MSDSSLHSSFETGVSMTRRRMISGALAAAGGAAAFAQSASGVESVAEPDLRKAATKRYRMKKSINQWAFPYPERMNLEECMRLAKDAGFDGIELNYDLENDLSPKSGTRDYERIRKLADKIGIAISGVCSFLFWPYPLTSNDPTERARGMELAGLMTRAAHDLGTENLLVVPGAVHMPWRDDHDPTPNDVCDRRAREAIGKLLPQAEKLKVNMNIENIFFNGYLMTPAEMVDFVDHFDSDYLHVHFDTGNIMIF
ncbi:MAG: sugar phosphate isomerase/epimerase family protein, partial [Verrucomicrobiota bacterium]